MRTEVTRGFVADYVLIIRSAKLLRYLGDRTSLHITLFTQSANVDEAFFADYFCQFLLAFFDEAASEAVELLKYF